MERDDQKKQQEYIRYDRQSTPSDETDIPESLNYPPEEDITRQAKKEPLDVENITRSGLYDKTPQVSKENDSDTFQSFPDELEIVPGTEADVTEEDIQILDSTDGMPISTLEKSSELDEEGLDIPGAELDDQNEALGEEDEENNYYSLGGDRHENLEEDQ